MIKPTHSVLSSTNHLISNWHVYSHETAVPLAGCLHWHQEQLLGHRHAPGVHPLIEQSLWESPLWEAVGVSLRQRRWYYHWCVGVSPTV